MLRLFISLALVSAPRDVQRPTGCHPTFLPKVCSARSGAGGRHTDSRFSGCIAALITEGHAINLATFFRMAEPISTPKAPSRTLVLCFDGTANKYGHKITNVIRLFWALEKKKPDQQVCYYQPGIGASAGLHRLPAFNGTYQAHTSLRPNHSRC